MEQVTFKDITGDQFTQSWGKLLNASLPIPAMLSLKKASRAIEQAHKDYDETRQAIIKQFAVLNEDGSVKTRDNGTVVFPEGADLTKLNELLYCFNYFN